MTPEHHAFPEETRLGPHAPAEPDCAPRAGSAPSVFAHVGFCQCGAAQTAYDYECPGCGRETSDDEEDIAAERGAANVWRVATDAVAHFTDRATAEKVVRVLMRQRLLVASVDEPNNIVSQPGGKRQPTATAPDLGAR